MSLHHQLFRFRALGSLLNQISAARRRILVILPLFLLVVVNGGLGLAQAQGPRLPTDPTLTATAFARPSGRGNVNVNFPSSPVQAIIPFYIQLTGKKLILDSSLQGEMLRIVSPTPLTEAEAIAFIESTLLLNGYAIIPVDDHTAKLVHHAGGKSPRSEGLPVITSVDQLPAGDVLVNFVLPLQHISPEEAMTAFSQVVQLHAYGAMTPVLNASAVIITENSATIRAVAALAAVIDVPPAEIANEMIKLERSDAESIAEIVQQIFEDSAEQGAPVRGVNGGGAGGGQSGPGTPPSTGAGQASPAGGNAAATNPSAAKVKIIPYRRTNHLLVIARPVDIAYIKGLVEKLDQAGDDVNFLKRSLSFVSVLDFLQVAYNALSRDTDIQSEGGDAPSGGGRGPSGGRLGAASGSMSGSSGFSGSGTSGFGSSGGGQGSVSLSEPPDAGAPESVVVGKTLLIADPQSNSLIVSGSPEHLFIVDKLLDEIDVRPQQIYISTVIGQLALGRNSKVGLDVIGLLNEFTLRDRGYRAAEITTTDENGGTTTTTGVVTGNTPNAGNTVADAVLGNRAATGGAAAALGLNANNGQAALAPGTLEFPIDVNNFDFSRLNLYGQIGALGQYINLMEGSDNFKVLARPSVYATNNVKSVISSGQRIAVPVSSLSNVGGIGSTAAVSSSIDYRDVVLKLEVIPLINSDDEVTLRIAQLNDNVIGTQYLGGNTIPTIGTQELLTTVTVKDGETVVLGGLITEREEKGGDGVVLLRRIPVVRHLFGVTETKTRREELLIFIQPHIIGKGERLDSPNDLESQRSRIFKDTRKFGERGTAETKRTRLQKLGDTLRGGSNVPPMPEIHDQAAVMPVARPMTGNLSPAIRTLPSRQPVARVSPVRNP